MWIEGRAMYREAEGGAGHPVTIALDMRGLTVRRLSGEDVALFAFGTLVRSQSARGGLVIGSKGSPARVEIADPASAAAFAAALKAVPESGAPTVPRPIFGCAALAFLCLLAAAGAIWWIVDDALEHLPDIVSDETARKIDDAVLPGTLAALGSNTDSRCVATEGGAALDALAARLAEAGGGRTVAPRTLVFRSRIANAVALPGGTIVLTDELLKTVSDGDELAGILAHEIAHVVHRDGVVQMLRQGGLSLAVGLMTGSPQGLAERLTVSVIGSGYSRDDEREADAYAVDAVAKAGGDPTALARIVERIGGTDPSSVAILFSSHPMTSERREAILARAAERTDGRSTAIVLPASLATIRSICPRSVQ